MAEKEKKCCPVCKLVDLLVGLGALNWGLAAYFQLNLVEKLLGSVTVAARFVYALIGIAGVVKLISLVKCCPCKRGSCETKK